MAQTVDRGITERCFMNPLAEAKIEAGLTLLRDFYTNMPAFPLRIAIQELQEALAIERRYGS